MFSFPTRDLSPRSLWHQSRCLLQMAVTLSDLCKVPVTAFPENAGNLGSVWTKYSPLLRYLGLLIFITLCLSTWWSCLLDFPAVRACAFLGDSIGWPTLDSPKLLKEAISSLSCDSHQGCVEYWTGKKPEWRDPRTRARVSWSSSMISATTKGNFVLSEITFSQQFALYCL